MICQVSLFISRLLLSLSIPKAKESSTVSTQARLFFRLGKHQKSPSVLPMDFADFADTETIESPVESETIADHGVDDLIDDSLKSPQESLDLVDSGDVAEVGADLIELDWDPLAKEASAEGESIDDLAKELTTDKESVAATQKVLANELKEESADVVVSGAEGVKGADGENGADPVTSDPVPSNPVLALEDAPEVVLADDVEEISDSGVDDSTGEAIADNQAPTDLADETLDTLEDQDVGETKDESDPVANVADDVDDVDDVADAESEESEQEELEIIGDNLDTEPNLLSQVESGFYTVDATGKVEFTFVFDGGGYKGQLAAISMTGMENLDLNSPEFFRESLQRALYGSEAKLGYIVIDDIRAGAMFDGELEKGFDYNHGEFAGTTIVEFRAGDKFFLMLIPNGSVAEVEAALEAGTTKDVRPLFSLVAANPTKAIQMGQIIDVTGDGNTYVFEDIRGDGASDKDFNDLIFQVKGATIKTVTLDELILEGEMSPEADWRNTEIGQQIVDYAASQVVLVPEPNPVEKYEFPKEDQPLIGFIDTHFTQGNPDIDYSRIIFGKDYIENDSDPTVVAVAGEGTHGDHILGIVAATQDNGVGIEGINDDAPLWVSSAVESGKWADALVEFVDAAIASNQPNAIINLSIDLTQVNPDGSVTTRYEFTPQERGAIEYARQSGVLIVAAAGNDGGVMSVLGQASQEFDNIITVGAADGLARVPFSSYGDGLDLMAEGGTVDNPIISNSGEALGMMAGTSVATAKVTGAASLVWAANPELSYQQVIKILKDTATDLETPGWDAETGVGLLKTTAAVGLAKITTPVNHEIPSILMTDTWSGEGKVIPTERAANFQYPITPANFSGTVAPIGAPHYGVAYRRSPAFGDRWGTGVAAASNTRLQFDAWTWGEVGQDFWYGNDDALWYRVAGTNYWVPSVFINGYPPKNPPLLPPKQQLPKPPDEQIPIKSLAGKKITLDPGHGNSPGVFDPGAIGNGTNEAVENMVQAQIIANYLKQRGAEVNIVDDGNLSQVQIGQRSSGSDLFVSLHLNHNHESATVKAQGHEVLYHPTAPSADLRLAQVINNELDAVFPDSEIPNRGLKPRGDLGVLRGAPTNVPAVLVESLFIDGRSMSRANVEKAAGAIARGIEKYLTGNISSGSANKPAPFNYQTGPGVPLTSMLSSSPKTDPPFPVTVKSSNGINLRTQPNMSARSAFTIPPNAKVTVDQWTYGERVTDLTTLTPDELWFRVTYNGQKYWIPSGWVKGYPPSNPPVLKPSNTTPPPSNPKTFNGKAKRQVNIWPNVSTRTNEGTPSTPNGVISAGSTLTFDGYWNAGERQYDQEAGAYDTKWFRLADGRGWVPSAFIDKNPPVGIPLVTPHNILPKSGGGNTSIDLAGLQKLLYGNIPTSISSYHGQEYASYLHAKMRPFYPDLKHPGYDFWATGQYWGKNASIYSPVSGVVIGVDDNNGLVYLYNEKSDITFRFLHMNSRNVNNGQSVNVGDLVGSEGKKGNGDGGHHLHFDARSGKHNTGYPVLNQSIDPVKAVNQARS